MTRVLIADDNETNIYLLLTILNGSGYEVTAARNGVEALESATDNPPDLIITDILMPEMDGFELCRRWHADDRLKSIPFIFYTATYTDPKDEQLALRLGADRFIIKPVVPGVMIDAVREVLDETSQKVSGFPAKHLDDEMEILRQYNEVLFRKLEKKIRQYEQEIVERRRAEAEAWEKEAFLDTIVENIPDMIFVKDAADLRFVRFNKAGEELLGYPRQELLGKNDYDLFPKAEADFFTGKDREVFQTRSGVDIPEETINTRAKGRRILHTKKIPLYDTRGLPKYLLGISEDITEHRKAEQEIELAHRKLALMTDVTYQDIQNKLTALTGYIELNKNTLSEEERLGTIEKELEILATIRRIIKNTKDYQQMGVDQLRWIPLVAMIQVQASLQSTRSDLALDIDLPGLEIYTDPLIERVFYNLISNAYKHGKTLSRILFRYREKPDGSIVISIGDDGIGIPFAEKDHIFERVVGGQGKFGLFFVREFLSLSGMTIIETGEPGKGARFEISVPEGKWRVARENKPGE